MKNMSMLEHVTPLGQPRSVNNSALNAISCNPEMKWPNDLEGQGQWHPLFNTSQENFKMHIWCKFGDSSSNLLSHCAEKPNFLKFWVEMAKTTLEVKVNDPFYDTNQE